MEHEKTLTFGVRDMTCASCVGRVEPALQAVSGVKQAQAHLAAETASLSINDPSNANDVIVDLVTDGYPACVQT